MSDKVVAFPPVDYEIRPSARLIIACASGVVISAEKPLASNLYRDGVKIVIVGQTDYSVGLPVQASIEIRRADLQELVVALQHSGVFRDDTV